MKVCPKCKGKGCSHCGGTGYHKGMNKGGLYANIHAKKARIAAGSKEKMRKPGTKGAPTAAAFKAAAKTVKR